MFALGRTAFYYGLIKLSIDKNNKILLPNYICKSLLVPINKLNLNYNYYRVNNNFEPNLEDIKKKNKSRRLFTNSSLFWAISKFNKNNKIL